MRLLLVSLLILNGMLLFSHAKPSKRNWSTYNYYAIEHVPQQNIEFDSLLKDFGMELVERVGELPNTWLVRSPASSRGEAPATIGSRSYHGSIGYLEQQTLRQRVKREGQGLHSLDAHSLDHRAAVDIANAVGIKDPEFVNQWHLFNDEIPANSMNVSGVWEAGITGKGVISAMVDDGVDYTSDDLKDNFDAYGSYDFNDHVDLPTPVLPEDTHGTRCAGEIAAGKNDYCGVGLAYESKIAGIRILSGPISDVDEAAALNYGFQNTSIYSCSWGPTDDGRSMEGPGYLVEKAFVNGIYNGRGGKGSIFVFASGNGAWSDDQCNFDGFTNSIYSITVGSVDYKNKHPQYSEACAANLVVTYSSGSGKSITTTDVARDGSGHKCTSGHSGTSAAAPNAAGVFALALSVRPELTWRDMQHLVVRTAVRINPEDKDWEKTTQGRYFSYKYGFGVLDAYNYVMAAKDWKLVKPQAFLELPPVQIQNGTMDLNNTMAGGEAITKTGVTSTMTITSNMLAEANLEALEHITVKVWIGHTRRGDVEVEIVSPAGVKSILAGKRQYDTASTGFPGWRFMSVKHWDEDPVGSWTIRVSHDPTKDDSEGHFLGWSMSLWGSSADASKVVQWDVPKLSSVFPPLHPDEADSHPVASSSISAAATSTKAYTNPTAALPDDHVDHPGEAEHPAFPVKPGTSASASPANATASNGTDWISDTKAFVSDQKYLFSTLIIIFIILGAVGICLQRRLAARRRRAQYAAVSDGETVPMRSVNPDSIRGDDDDADEETMLRPGINFHEDFLDDDAATPRSSRGYRDDPEEHQDDTRHERRSPSGGSGGSWEHAS